LRFVGIVAGRALRPVVTPLRLFIERVVREPTQIADQGAIRLNERRGDARAGRLVWHRRPFAATDLDGAWLAFTATGDPAVDAAVHTAGEQLRVWVNSADDPANCSFTLMSVIRRADLVVSVGTGGRSPALAAHVRRRLDEEIGPEYEVLVDLLAGAREAIRASGRSSEDANWQAAFDGGIVEMVRDGRIDDAKEWLRTCL